MNKKLLFLFLLVLILPAVVFSACPSGTVCIENPLNAPDFNTIVDNLINFIFKISIILVPLMIIVGAFFIMTAAGDPKKVGTGKNMIIYTLVGFTIVLLAKGILNVIKQLLGVI